jgi:hypothetical protein
MSLGVGLLLLLVVLAGAAPVSAEPLAALEAKAVEHFDLMDWAWEWLTSLVSDATPGGSSAPGGGILDGVEGGAFIDPLGGNS